MDCFTEFSILICVNGIIEEEDYIICRWNRSFWVHLANKIMQNNGCVLITKQETLITDEPLNFNPSICLLLYLQIKWCSHFDIIIYFYFLYIYSIETMSSFFFLSFSGSNLRTEFSLLRSTIQLRTSWARPLLPWTLEKTPLRPILARHPSYIILTLFNPHQLNSPNSTEKIKLNQADIFTTNLSWREVYHPLN